MMHTANSAGFVYKGDGAHSLITMSNILYQSIANDIVVITGSDRDISFEDAAVCPPFTIVSPVGEPCLEGYRPGTLCADDCLQDDGIHSCATSCTFT
jgi:hypothetical protein